MLLAAQVSGTLVDALGTDADADGRFDPGDTIRYTGTVSNTGDAAAAGVSFTAATDANTTVVGGVLRSPVTGAESYNAIGNTPLVVSAANGVRANDTDLDGVTPNASLVVTAGTFATTQGGSVTIAADGSFTYNPQLGDQSVTDTFTYAVTDSDGLTGTGTVTINLGQRVWYVDNTAAAGGNGYATTPFNSLASVSGATGPDTTGDILFLRTGSGNYTGGITLLGSQTLWGQGDALVVNSVTVSAAGTDPTIANAAGAGVTLASGNTVRGLTIGSTTTAGISGPSVAGATIANVAITAGSAGVSLTSPSGAFTFDANTSISGVTGDAFTLNGGSAAITYSGSITESGGGRAISVINHTTGTLTFQTGAISSSGGGIGISINSSTGTYNFNNPTLTLNTAASSAVSILSGGAATANFGGALDIDTTSGTGVDVQQWGTLTFSGSGSKTIDTTTGTAINLDTVTAGAAGIAFNSVNTSGAATGININNLAGTGAFSVTGGAIVNASSRGVDVNGGTNNITYGGTISTTGSSATGRSVEITSHTGGTVLFSGAITDSLGINLASNTGATINFTGALSLNTGANAAFTATGGGTVNITQNNTTIVNTITTTSGSGLNISGTTIGGSGVTFRSINSGAGAGNGISLSGTGSGNFTITGNGTTNSGGVISGRTGADATNGTTGTGIYLNSVSGAVSITRMDIEGNQNYGIRGIGVTGGLTLDNTTVGVTAKNGNNNFSSPGNQMDAEAVTLLGGEASVRFTNLTGTVNFTNDSFDNGFGRTVLIHNSTAGSTLNLNITNSTLRQSLNNTNGGDTTGNSTDALTIQGINNTVMNTTVTGSHFTAYRQFGLLSDARDTASMSFEVANCDFSNDNGNLFTGEFGNANASCAINFSGGGGTATDVHVKYNVHDNTFRHGSAAGTPTNGGAQIVSGTVSGGGAFDGKIVNNVFGVSGVTNSGAGGGADVLRLFASGNLAATNGSTGSTHTRYLVQGNTIQNYGETGIQINARQGSAIIDATVIGNTIRQPGTPARGAFAGIWVNSGALATDSNAVNIAIGGTGAGQKNTLTDSDPLNLSDVFLDNRSDAGAPTTITLFRNGATTTTGTGIDLVKNILIEDNNPTLDQSTNNGYFTNQSTIGVQTGLPSQPALLAAPGGVAAARPIGTKPLTQTQLNSIKAAAIRSWQKVGRLTAGHATVLRAVSFEVRNLAGQTLGLASGGNKVVKIDADAAGYGWYVDATPADDKEFAVHTSATRLYATPTAAPAGRVDLLTAVMHELGHVLGLDHDTANRDSLMFDALTTGERRLPPGTDLGESSQAVAPTAAPTAPVLAVSSGPVARQSLASTSVDVVSAQAAPPVTAADQGGGEIAALIGATSLGNLAPGSSVQIRYFAQINSAASLPIPTSQVESQGTITYTGGPAGGALTDDPDLAGTANPTVSVLENRPPVNSVPLTTQTVNEDAPLVFFAANANLVSVTDPDAAASSSLTVTLAATNGTLTLGSTAGLTGLTGNNTANVSFSGTPANVNGALNGLSFNPTANYNGAAGFQITTNDNGNTGTGPAGSDVDSVSINVVAVNDPPTFTLVNPPAVNEDAASQSVLNIATSRSTGPANESAQSLTGFTLTPTGTTGNLTFSTAPSIDPTTGTLTYQPAANTNGTATFDVRLVDNGSSTPPNVNTSLAQSLTITVAAVNDAPSFTPGANQVVLAGSGAQTVNGWATGFSPGGGSDEAGQGVVSYAITNNTTPAIFSAGPAISAAGVLTFTPAASVAVPTTATISATVRDSGGTANGGVDVSSVKNFTITMLPPIAATTQIADGTAQRSEIKEVTVTFNQDVTLDADAITLVGRSGAGAGMTVLTANPSGDFRTFKLTFSGSPIVGGSLADGIYDLTVVATKVHAKPNTAIVMAANLTAKFHRLFSDIDGDGDSDNADLFQFRSTYNKFSPDPAYNANCDYDADGDVDNADIFQIRSRRSIVFQGY